MSTPQVNELSVGPMDNNVYILTCPVTGRRALIDPANDAETILNAIGDGGLVYILLTHGDADHFQALEAVREATGAPVGMHPADRHMLEGHRIDFDINEGDVIQFGEVALEVFHTPGHTAGGICFYTMPYLFAG
ncbi:MAG TPA: MBL fold metallo-hydrolase, partial [Chloroflexota bacterium]|nr:MBL fold metallo-hydrolase [Chloroflexota bacterium]